MAGLQSLLASKKAQETDIAIFGKKVPMIIVFTILLGILVAFFITFTTFYNYKNMAMPEGLQHQLYASRFFSYAGCFAYQDPNIQRTYPYLVDLAKFTDEQLLSCLQLPLEKDDLCYELRLSRLVPKGDGSAEELIRVIHSNNYQETCTKGADINAAKRPVVIVDGDRRMQGMVTVSEFTKA